MDSDTDNSIIAENKNPTIDFKWVFHLYQFLIL